MHLLLHNFDFQELHNIFSSNLVKFCPIFKIFFLLKAEKILISQNLTLSNMAKGRFTLAYMSHDYLHGSHAGLPGWIRVNQPKLLLVYSISIQGKTLVHWKAISKYTLSLQVKAIFCNHLWLLKTLFKKNCQSTKAWCFKLLVGLFCFIFGLCFKQKKLFQALVKFFFKKYNVRIFSK